MRSRIPFIPGPMPMSHQIGQCANFERERVDEKTLHSVGSLPGSNSPYGVKDMVGNARERVADWYDADYYRTRPRAIRRGWIRRAWCSPASDLTITARRRGGFAFQIHLIRRLRCCCKGLAQRLQRPEAVPVHSGDAELRTASPAEADRFPRDGGTCRLGELEAL
ncbi:MAG: SUMF1/EgtB/PvdO family nonheme iron enzyme [Nitrospira sp.]|nr:SUMF1/EgtB/PvdO family nonheme iron enzyme [Nitrospira sp.]